MDNTMVLVDKSIITDVRKQAIAFKIAIGFLRQLCEAAKTSDDMTVKVSIFALYDTIGKMDDALGE